MGGYDSGRFDGIVKIDRFSKKAWDEGRVLIPRWQKDGVHGWIAGPLARRKRKKAPFAGACMRHHPSNRNISKIPLSI